MAITENASQKSQGAVAGVVANWTLEDGQPLLLPRHREMQWGSSMTAVIFVVIASERRLATSQPCDNFAVECQS